MIHTFDAPDSSTVTSASYDDESKALTVEFRRGTSTVSYDYANIPKALWDDFDAAPSKGKFFGAHIRPLYSGVQKP